MNIDEHTINAFKVVPKRHRALAIGVWLQVEHWSSTHGDDGFVPRDIVTQFGGAVKISKMIEETGLWTVQGTEGVKLASAGKYAAKRQANATRMQRDRIRAKEHPDQQEPSDVRMHTPERASSSRVLLNQPSYQSNLPEKTKEVNSLSSSRTPLPESGTELGLNGVALKPRKVSNQARDAVAVLPRVFRSNSYLRFRLEVQCDTLLSEGAAFEDVVRAVQRWYEEDEPKHAGNMPYFYARVTSPAPVSEKTRRIQRTLANKTENRRPINGS